MKIIAVTQARFGSTRFPGKVLQQINGETLLAIHLKRGLRSKLINKLIVATTTEPQSDQICKIATSSGCDCYKGSMNDVLDRFYQCVKGENPDYVVRITSDCPLVDSVLMDKIIQYAIDKNLDYCSNTLDPKYPDGMDVEVFRYTALEKAWNNAVLPSDREHVTPYVWRNSSYKGGVIFNSDNFDEGLSFGHLRLTVDVPEDFEVIKNVISALGVNCSWLEYAHYMEKHQNIKKLNEDIRRNEGYKPSNDIQ